MIWGLNFWWFVALGLLGAVGDIPGMTARDALLPAVTKHDDVDLQRFMGLSQSLDSLVTIVGPALAALSIGLVGGVPSLWFTAALSFSAALATATIPRCVGAVRSGAPANEGDATAQQASCHRPLARCAPASACCSHRRRADGLHPAHVRHRHGHGIVPGLVLPVFFTDSGRPELLGYVLSTMSLGLLASSLAYAAFAPRLSRRTWYVLSMFGMLLGVAILGALPPTLMLLARLCWA
ncbi:MAG: hypothetical protein ACLSVD_18515 [Eggerthellaceae bacterium]